MGCRALALCALAACDGLFGIQAIEPLDARQIVPRCTPSLFSDVGVDISDMIVAFALPADQSFAIVKHSTDNTWNYASPVAPPLTFNMIPTLAGSIYDPALSPDGTELFVGKSASPVNESTRGATLADWSPDTDIVGLPSLSPGTPASVGGALLIMLWSQTQQSIVEYGRDSGGAWTAHASSTAAMLVGFDGSIRYPGLTPDGRVLYFVLAGSTNEGVWFVERDVASDPFVGASGGQRVGNIFPEGNSSGVNGLYLTDDCQHLYISDGATLRRHDQP